MTRLHFVGLLTFVVAFGPAIDIGHDAFLKMTMVEAPTIVEPIGLESRILDCSSITHMALHGTHLQMYAKNGCKKPLTYTSWHWSQRSKEGYIVAEDMTSKCGVPREHSTEAVCRQEIKLHKKTARIVVFTKTTS